MFYLNKHVLSSKKERKNMTRFKIIKILLKKLNKLAEKIKSYFSYKIILGY